MDASTSISSDVVPSNKASFSDPLMDDMLNRAREKSVYQYISNKSSQPQSLPENVFSSKAPLSTTPGTRELDGIYINDQGKVQPWKAAYDKFGRQYERTDWNAGNIKQGIPDTHFHQRIYLPNGQAQRIDHIQGVGPNTKK